MGDNAPPMSLQSSVDSFSYTAALTCALAREEARDGRNHRLLETGPSSTWNQFRGRLGPSQLLGLLVENAAVRHPIPFDSERVLGVADAVETIPPTEAEALISEARAQPLDLPPSDYLLAQARRLFINTRLARSELHVVKASQRVLELPGTGGQLAHHLSHKHDLPFREVFTIACADWRELTLAGIAALDCRVLGEPKTLLDPDLAQCRDLPFDMVVGLAPEKGGRFAVRQLEGWFPKIPLVLV